MSWDFSQTQKLREDVLAGKIAHADAKSCLLAAIEAEYEKENADINFINACEDLLMELQTGGEWPAFPTAEQYAAGMQKYMRVKQKPPALFKTVWRCAAVVATMLVVVILGGRALRWFTGTSTEDEWQYESRGQEITVSMIAESIAEHGTYRELITDDWDEVVAFLGVVPNVPKAANYGFDSVQYVAMVDSISLSLYAQYRGQESDDPVLLCSVYYFTEADNAYMVLGENPNGFTELVGDREVHIAKDMERNTFAWFENTTVYRLAGDISYETGIQMVRSIRN